MLKRFTTFLTLVVAFSSLPSVVPGGAGQVLAQNRRIMLEEFTGAWCGWCVRGALAIKQLDEKYPGQVSPVAVHGPMSYSEPMATLQGDSLIAGTGGAMGDPNGYPDGWTARSGSNWNVDPGTWIDTLNGTGIVDGLVGQPADASVLVDGVSYDANSQTISATVHVTFNTATTGDLRFNMYVVEDSITGTGTNWLQHNYYYHSPNYPTSPYYNYGTGTAGSGTIANYVFNHVFRQAVVGVWGLSGVIPAKVSKGSTYSQKFTFPLPDNVMNANHVSLLGFVHQYSKTNAASNTILDVDQVPLIGSRPKYLTTSITVNSPDRYMTAKSNGDVTSNVSFSNNGTDPVTLSLGIDPALVLPTGWVAKITPPSLSIDPGNVGKAVLTVTAPENSGYVTVKFNAIPVKEGYLVTTYSGAVSLLSDNVRCGIFASGGAAEAAVLTGIPDSLKTHSAVIPLNASTYSVFPTTYPVTIYNNVPILDNGGIYTDPTVVTDITSQLNAGGKVFINSIWAMYYGLDPNFSQSGSTQTQDVLDFYARLGLSTPHSINRYTVNSSNQITGLKSFTITGTTDPISKGISVTDVPTSVILTEDYTIDSNSTPLFYFDGKPKEIAGSWYKDPATHARLVYLGFDFGGISKQASATTIMQNCVNWLLSSDAAGVSPTAVGTATGLVASANPFRGTTKVTYTTEAGERDVTFAAYDVLGREVSKPMYSLSGDNTYTASFDARKLGNGTYTIIARSSLGSKEIRVVNQN